MHRLSADLSAERIVIENGKAVTSTEARTPLANCFSIPLVQRLQTPGQTGEIDASSVELKKCVDEIFSGTGD